MSGPTVGSLKDAAHSYAQQHGWRVVPLHSVNAAGHCSCKSGSACRSAGKHPLIKAWQDNASRSGADIETWWGERPQAGVGIATGADSGLFVLDVDIDPAKYGPDTLAALEAEHGELTRTRKVRTGSGGWQLYFRWPRFDVTNSAGKLGPGLDVRGNGGQVVAPPSRSGKGDYTLEVDAPLADAPDWLLDLLRPPERAATNGVPVSTEVASHYATRVLEREVQVVRDTKHNRNDQLNKSAYSLGTLVAVGALNADHVRNELAAASVANGYVAKDGEAAMEATLESGLTSGMDNPRTPWPPAGTNGVVLTEEDITEFRAMYPPGSSMLADLLGTYATPADLGLPLAAPALNGSAPAATDATGPPPEPPTPADPPADADEPPPPEVADTAPEPNGHRRRINAKGRDFRDLRREILAALAASNKKDPKLFVHGSDMVIAGRGQLQPLDQPLFNSEMADRVEFFGVSRPRGGGAPFEHPVDPPGGVLAAFLSGRQNLGLPEVDRVAHTPFFGPDGTLQRTPGYHRAARVLYVPEPGLIVPEISTNPTPSEISAAYKMLTEELLGDFKFAHPGDKAGALAAGLAPYIRPMIAGSSPIMAFDAPQSRSGKGLLAEALFWPACGRSWTITPAPTRLEEWHKTIVASLRSGPLVAMFDNVNNKVDSGALASAVTAWPNVTSRVLGLSQNVHMPLPAVWAVTGNNLRFSTENVERSVRIRIDAGEENPGRRTGFRHPDLRGWYTANRGQVVAAWLTLIQAWIAAGRPVADTPAIGGFEKWVSVTGSILAFHGNHDLLSNRDDFVRTMDDDREEWIAFMEYWIASGELERTVTQLVVMALESGGPGCPVNLDLGNDRSQVTRMGHGLGKLRGQRFDGYTLEKQPRSSSGRGWYLKPVKPPIE